MDEIDFSKKQQWELMWFSTFLFVLVALLIRFVINLQTAVMMRYFHVGFKFKVFGNILAKAGRGNWSDWKVIMVFAIGPLVAFGLGLLLIRMLKNNKQLVWKSRLFLTWLAFIMIHILPMSTLIGVFIYDDFGYALANVFMSGIFRAVFSLLILVLTVYFWPVWMGLFLKTAYSLRIVEQQALFMKLIFIRPWMIGTLIIFPFAAIGHYWAWFMLMISMGLMAFPIIRNREFKFKLRLTKTDEKFVFKNKFSIFSTIFIIILLFFLSFISIPM